MQRMMKKSLLLIVQSIPCILFFSVFLVLYSPSALAVSLTTPHFTIEYSGISEKYARLVADSAEHSLPRISRALGRDIPAQITIVLTDTPERFRELTAGTLPDWSAAVAVPGRRIIFSPLAGQKIEMEKILAHELVHVVIDEAAGEEYVPRWFHEGCAELFSGGWGLRNELYMAWRVTRGRMMNFDNIQDVFSSGSLDAGLAYDQSMLAVRFLVNEYGRTALSRILTSLNQGNDFPEAFLNATGLLPTGFEDEYFRFLRGRYGPLSLMTLVPSTWTIIMALFLLVYLVKRRRTKRKLAEWAREESTGGSLPFTSVEDEDDLVEFEEYPDEEPDNILKFKPRPERYGGEDEEE
jgi:hypothetical protein